MNKTFFSLPVLLLSAFPVFAQKAPVPPAAKDQTRSIVIRKKGSDKEKMTIVIDGDKVTVNGKPLQDYKGDIRITDNSVSDLDFVAPLPPSEPEMPGGVKFFSRNNQMHTNSAFLGVYTESADKGAKINSITKNSPADKTGLKEGDIITKINNDRIADADDLMEAIGKYKPEDKITVTYLRDTKENTMTVTLEKNSQPGFAYSFGNREFMNRFRDFSLVRDNDKPQLGISVEDTEAGTGIRITDVHDEDSPAGKAGLHEDDVITQINGKAVASVTDAKDILAGLKEGDNVTVNYQRKGNAQTATVHIPKPLNSADL